MKYCQSHWNRLRQAIEQHGMEKLVARDGQAAAARLVKEIEGRADLLNFDPLMAAHNEITRRFLEPLGADGLYVFMGDYCPLCELVRLNPQKPQLDANWINGCTKELQDFCLKEGLITAS